MNLDRKLMATTVQTPKSSIKSSSSTAEVHRCCCRRDANCNCDICIESFNLTFDLLPISVQRTKLSSSKPPPSPPETPIFCNPSTISTPKSDDTSRLMVSPPLNSTLRTDFRQKINRRKVELGYCVVMMKLVLVLCLILIGKFGVSVFKSGVMRTKLTSEMVRNLDLREKSQGFHERFEFLDGGEVQDLVGVGVPESSFSNPNWKLVQDGLIMRSSCQLYKSEMEEVSSIWGWPWQTAGLLTNKFASRSLTILSGRLTEQWSNGELSCSIRKANTSWEQEKWSALLWRLDDNTWILEYKRSFVFDNTNPFSSVTELLKFGITSAFQWMKHLWRFSAGFVDGAGDIPIPMLDECGGDTRLLFGEMDLIPLMGEPPFSSRISGIASSPTV
ncbi:hypothetical protein OSB04_030958 [Centaurea solstitialis]|uniref:Uncharacterized protein n=1 Tax=Centaurea solstitialis TaxID=347529 RepID=A0AA38SL95_9ASTR|nr:hypothetical protein OSB04_030958 [Centaurea solstitialis]